MLGAWSALVHSPWCQFRWDILSRSFSRTIARLNTTQNATTSHISYPSSQPDENVFEGISGDYVAAHLQVGKDVPKFIRLSGTLVSLVRAGRYADATGTLRELDDLGINVEPDPIYLKAARYALQEAPKGSQSQLFKRWIRLVPDAGHVTLEPLREIRDILKSESVDDLLVDFAFICLSKNFLTFVKEDILPSITNPSSYEHLRQALLEKTAQTPAPPVDSARMSTVTHVIRATLPERLPNPSSAQSIFESSQDEYLQITNFLSSYAPLNITQHLEEAVRSYNFAQATALLPEIRALDIHIPQSPVYEIAAQYILRYPYHQQNPLLSRHSNAESAFATWFSLVPSAHDAPPDFRDMTEIRRLLFLTTTTDLSLVKRWALICAEKGYALDVVRQAVRCIVRYTSWHEADQFIRDFIALAKSYQRPQSSTAIVDLSRIDAYDATHNAALHIAKTEEEATAAVVISLAQVKRFKEAVDFVIGDHPHSRPSLSLLNNLTHLLRLQHRDDLISLVSNVAVRTREEIFSSGQDDVGFLSTLMQELNEESWRTNDVAVENPESTGSLANQARFFRRVLTPLSLPPTFGAVLAFIENCVKAGRWSIVNSFRKRAYRCQPHTIYHWACAEMVTLFRLGLHAACLRLFVQTFHLVGLPPAEVLQLIRFRRIHESRNLRGQRLTPWKDTRLPTQGILPEMLHLLDLEKNRTVPSRGKLWPRPGAISLAWQSTIALTAGVHSVRLYHALMIHAKHAYELKQNEQNESSSELRSRVDWTMDLSRVTPPNTLPVVLPANSFAIEPAAFTPFIRRLMLMNVAYGPHILKDILSVGLAPSVYHYTEVAASYARFHQHADKAFAIVDLLESALDSRRAAASRHIQANISDVPPADTIFYDSVIRGFLISADYRSARIVEQRRLARFPYVRGQDEGADRNTDDLRRWESERKAPYTWQTYADNMAYNCIQAEPSLARTK
ncbi:hypothetical protein FISHEDRAFT_74691 [Fistulina hepatica ATCC 64428]|uniref:Uncharacterized protein n=1 Tax=Fistulina hepatica ATCC 64428 TaxID=1128425 RepID=A0A0D7ABT0_9AGAR|nr:hypothetical protein FISHEDRAFT_74691 [Fistulina hepatica ATCC 64428]